MGETRLQAGETRLHAGETRLHAGETRLHVGETPRGQDSIARGRDSTARGRDSTPRGQVSTARGRDVYGYQARLGRVVKLRVGSTVLELIVTFHLYLWSSDWLYCCHFWSSQSLLPVVE